MRSSPTAKALNSTDYTCSETNAEYFAKPSEKGLEMTMGSDETSLRLAKA